MISRDRLIEVLHARAMKFGVHYLTLLMLPGACSKPNSLPQPDPESAESRKQETSSELIADELARALKIVWCEMILPGSPEDQWQVGSALEFGDGRKASTSGTVSPLSGGSVIKLLAQWDGDNLKVSILGEELSSSHTINLPPGWGEGTRIHKSGQKIDIKEFLFKETKKGGVDSSPNLKKDGYGLRLRLEPDAVPLPAAHSPAP